MHLMKTSMQLDAVGSTLGDLHKRVALWRVVFMLMFVLLEGSRKENNFSANNGRLCCCNSASSSPPLNSASARN